MAHLAKLIAGLPLAVSVFAAQQLVNALSDPRKALASIYSARGAVIEQFETKPLLFASYQVGNEIQRSAVDLLSDAVELRLVTPQWVSQAAARLADQVAETAKALRPGGNLGYSLDVLRNTFGVINLVNEASSMLNLPPGPIHLEQAIERAYSFGEYAPPWLIEGLGQAYADQEWSRAASKPTNILSRGDGAELQERTLLMMHAGLGIAFAKKVLSQLTPVTPRADIHSALTRFVELVRANVRSGYEGPALESLGLVARTWYTEMVQLVDEQLGLIDVKALEYFWHGVGRSMYFSPLYQVPGNTPLKAVRREAPHQLGVLNATAGVAWAFTLVNIRQPELLSNLVCTQAPLIEENDSFTNGVMSALVVASDLLPEDPYVRGLCGYQPSCACCSVSQQWKRLVGQPCAWAQDEAFPVLKAAGRLGDVFRYCDWETLGLAPEVPY